MKLAIKILALIFLLFGCAQPKYVNKLNSENGSVHEEKKSNCDIVFTKSKMCLSWKWEEKPTSSEMGSLIFKTFRLNNYDQTAIQIDPIFEQTSVPQVVLWMPSMGHGSSPTNTIRLDVGTFRVSDVFFIMPGEWQIKFQIKNGEEVLDEAQVAVSI